MNERERFLARVVVDESGCHLWDGCKNKKGYGIFTRDGRRNTGAHRWAIENLAGRHIPEGMVVHHKCYRRDCVNPEHLDIVTPRENVLDVDSSAVVAANFRRTVCVNGHPLDGSNVTVYPNGRRRCVACNRERSAARRNSPALDIALRIAELGAAIERKAGAR